ncbi:non-homologous end-joining DNA ligase [Terrilactibacillus laevilacticus]|uniref:Non-homologous end-joining DNA ligase n=1 Tax=Terrilactibacillus laevilacticus TaxID=1380157 RepID=A0ABW5PQI7_9BACI|nr:non-homologous end-joining DNA ligase [Terrilactibacillus laevilacticus]
MGQDHEKQQVIIEGHSITLTHLSKILWKEKKISKAHYLQYLTSIAPYVLPFFKNRALTLIRYPHGVPGESFFQKSIPDYAPEIVRFKGHIHCDQLASLIWLGNQSTIEFHIPFQYIGEANPCEIVFDLDPPSKEDFSVAVLAAKTIKEILDRLHLTGFVKTSGSRGIQIHIPLIKRTFTYHDTRLFTTFVAKLLLEMHPNQFTTERLKHKRNNKLYLDIVQHGKNKTIIAPYSMRANEQGLVAAPLDWKEVNSSLRLETFTHEVVIQRLHTNGDPFQSYFNVENEQAFRSVLEQLNKNKAAPI